VDFSNACVEEELCISSWAFVTTTARYFTCSNEFISTTMAVNQESDTISILQTEDREIKVKSISELLMPG